MNRSKTLLAAIVSVFSWIVAVVPTAASANPETECPTELYENLGNLHFAVTTESPLAQRYFDQGLMLAYGFNHDESYRFFQKAGELDAKCAMCFWGQAYVLGPNINKPMDPADATAALHAVQKALLLSDHVSDREKALIFALAKRYAPGHTGDRAALDLAYTEAMADVNRRFPDDANVASLYAEALMDTMPWDYWEKDKKPKPATVDALAALEKAMAIDVNHAGANHLYIHIVESVYPHLGLPAADRLRTLNPDTGHLVHMPAHIYIGVGDYDAAITANIKAIATDKRYLARCRTGFYTMMYVPHNYDFLIAASALEGRSELAIKTSHELSASIDLHAHAEMVDAEGFWAAPLLAYARFGHWDKILAWPEPPEHALYAKALWHYTRALALTRQGQSAEAAAAIGKLAVIAAEPTLAAKKLMGLNPVSQVLAIAVHEASGELALANHDFAGATEHLRQAVHLQDRLIYIEPPPWYHSVRLTLGKALLKAGNAEEAAAAFREDLARFPENGWALFGLHMSLEKQGRLAEPVRARFSKAWQRADVALVGPVF